MTRKQLLDTARALSRQHAKQMHAWGVVSCDGADHLGLYLYLGPSNVQLTLVHRCDVGADSDEAKLIADHLNGARGLGHEGVMAFVTAYEGGIPGRLLSSHLHPS